MKIFVIFLFCLFRFLCVAQSDFHNDSIPINQINFLNSEYKDFVSVNNIIYAISQNHDLISVDFKRDSFKLIENNITAIAKKSNEELVFGSKDGKIFTLNKRQQVKQIEKIDAEIFSILINSKDEYVIYSNKSIYFNKKDYIPRKETNFYGRVRYTGTLLIEPDFIFLDKMDFIWFTYDEGEWGGKVCFFDLNKKEFIYGNSLSLDDDDEYKDRNDYFAKLKEKYPEIIKVTERDTSYSYPYNLNISSTTKGVAYNNTDDLFITSSGGGHTMIYVTENDFHYYVDGTIEKISSKGQHDNRICFEQDILENDKYKLAFERDNRGFKNTSSELRNNLLTDHEINKLGTIVYNKYNNKLYFFSLKGFYTLNNLDCTFSKNLFFSPELTCKVQNKRAYCTHLNVTKFEFISEKEILFLTKNNGIGYFNGESIKYFR